MYHCLWQRCLYTYGMTRMTRAVSPLRRMDLVSFNVNTVLHCLTDRRIRLLRLGLIITLSIPMLLRLNHTCIHKPRHATQIFGISLIMAPLMVSDTSLSARSLAQ